MTSLNGMNHLLLVNLYQSTHLFSYNLIFFLIANLNFDVQLSTGKLTANSYVPNGLTREQYEKIRAGEVAAKDANYKRNVAKAGKFEDYTEFYTKRGTDLTGAWKKSVTNGHKMVKTKYDWSGAKGEDAGWFTPPKK